MGKEQMKELYESLELPEEEIKTFLESDGSGTHVFNNRFEALHLKGTEEMSTQDVFDYFRGYAPASIEWINDSSCNVVWLESWQAARAMIERSAAITKSEVSDTNEDEMDLEAAEKLSTPNSSAPGVWRMGFDCPQTNSLLIRFATRSDRKIKGAERMSKYYTKYGNPNYGGMVGLISSSRKRRYRGLESPPLPVDSKNPWGSLAEAWRTDEQDELWQDNLQVKRQGSTSLPSALVRRLGHQPPRPSPSRSRDTESDASEDLSSDSGSDSSDSSYHGRSLKKRPRMRMYADEEEEKEKRRSRKRKDREGNDFKDLTYEMGMPQKSRSVHTRLGSIVSAVDTTTEAATDLRQKISAAKKAFSPADAQDEEPTLDVDDEDIKIDLRRKLQSRVK